MAAVLLALSACGGNDKKDGPNSPKAGGPGPTNVGVGDNRTDEAKVMLSEFLKPGADFAALTRPLRPSGDDFKAVFVGEAAAKAEAGYKQPWDDGLMVVKPKPGQTQLLIWSATTEQLRQGVGDADQFPGGYKDIADHLKPGVRWYRFRFVEPGEQSGISYDGLVFINGQWRIFPKPWRVLE